MSLTKIKKLYTAISGLLIVLAMVSACDRISNEDTPTTPQDTSPVTSEEISTAPSMGDVVLPDMNPPMPLPEYPIIDGSTSTELMDTAIQGYLADEYFSVTHSRTYDALERLIPGNDNPADVVLAVKYYDEALQDAKDRGANLVVTPIAREGFIFILNSGNAVSDLTQQQLRDIYSGKITNWEKVGGRDRKIIPYIRNQDSGSQTAMEDFMDGEPIAGREDDLLAMPIISMPGLLTQIQGTGSPGIGYSIYSWSILQDLVTSGISDLKTVAVDGVKPNNKTLADGSYPLMVYTYSYYNEGNEKGKALTDWLLTAEGQSVIASAGYVGLFGELPTDETPDFYKDENEAKTKIVKYYVENGMLYQGPYPAYYNLERLTDKDQTEAFAIGKSNAVTVLYLVRFTHYKTGQEDPLHFIVLAKEKGGDFEVINEGEVLSYENGVITPSDLE
jgi:hypothetical protein